MVEWWTYRPSDFLMFSARTYGRLFELANADAWPLALAAAAAGLAWGLRARRGVGPALARAGWLGLAGAWAWVAVDFLARRFAAVNWPAEAVAWAFGAQALALAAAAVFVRPLQASPIERQAGLALLLAALLGHPLLAALAGRPWTQAECFGLAPDPTVIATLGLLLATRAPAWLWPLPAAAALGAAAMLATLGWWQAVVPAAALLLALGLRLRTRRAGRQTG